MKRARYAAGLLLAWSTMVLSAPFQSSLEPAGPQAAHVHTLWHVMLATCAVVFVVVFAAFIIAVWRAPRVSESSEPRTTRNIGDERGGRRAVTIAAVISIAGLLGLLVASVTTDRALASLPLDDGVVIQVNGQQWWWQATYYAGDPVRTFDTANELHIPVGKPVLLKLESPDV